MLELNQIHLGDCLELMKELPPKSVDFSFSDPPYNKNKDYEIYKDNLSDAEYYNFIKKIISECNRISQKGIGFFVGADIIKKFWDLMPEAKLIIVRKGAIGTPFKDYYRQYSGLLCTAKPNGTVYDLWTDIRMPGEGYFFREQRFPHPGLTSLKLTQRIVNYYTLENDLVFDPFMGTGTTAIASMHLKRNYLGVEINPHYIEIFNKRLEDYKSQMKMEFEK